MAEQQTRFMDLFNVRSGAELKKWFEVWRQSRAKTGGKLYFGGDIVVLGMFALGLAGVGAVNPGFALAAALFMPSAYALMKGGDTYIGARQKAKLSTAAGLAFMAGSVLGGDQEGTKSLSEIAKDGQFWTGVGVVGREAFTFIQSWLRHANPHQITALLSSVARSPLTYKELMKTKEAVETSPLGDEALVQMGIMGALAMWHAADAMLFVNRNKDAKPGRQSAPAASTP